MTKQTSETQTAYLILYALSISHLLNDTLQSLIPSIYPIVKENYQLTFSQIGLITLTFQLTASLFQPLVGLYTDKKPQPFSLAVGMSFTLVGLIALSFANHFYFLLVSVAMIGTGSSIFHPEASRIAACGIWRQARLCAIGFSGRRECRKLVWSLLAAWIVVPHGQRSIFWFTAIAFTAIMVLRFVGSWYQQNVLPMRKTKQHSASLHELALPRKRSSKPLQSCLC